MGFMDYFKKNKPVEKKMEPLTPEQRDLIRSAFPRGSNVDVMLGKNYALEYNAHASNGRIHYSFRNEEGQLMVTLSYYANERDVHDPHKSPITHESKPIFSLDDLQKIMM